jgi:hypothetical protein
LFFIRASQKARFRSARHFKPTRSECCDKCTTLGVFVTMKTNRAHEMDCWRCNSRATLRSSSR